MLELRYITETTEDYTTLKPMHENLCYSDVDSTISTPRTPFITDYNSFVKELGRSNYFFVILDGKEIGYIIMDAFLTGICQIKEICIIPELQRRGYGRAALKYLAEALKEDDSISELKAISATLGTDIFYQKCNFLHTNGDSYALQILH